MLFRARHDRSHSHGASASGVAPNLASQPLQATCNYPLLPLTPPQLDRVVQRALTATDSEGVFRGKKENVLLMPWCSPALHAPWRRTSTDDRELNADQLLFSIFERVSFVHLGRECCSSIQTACLQRYR